ncbi:uncharacterized protein si:dkey-21c1.1 [Takifugu flavidus]|uniref:Uncharacterized protein n=1 Tax=Takifugu bimaculatus TaxID=433685 RepID=A0A4Z2CIL1_9TELE|nr:uncharacterized protein si:dkey-21c1.1 [Takifugu flavidus]TNN04048.1 hypothetical protein fugu_001077 [Takifugu bimaculatus]
MLTSSRKRHHSCDSEEDQQLARQAKRSPTTPSLLVSDLDSESSSSDSSNGISSPECAIVVSARPCIHSQNHCISRDSLTLQPEDCTSSSQYGFHGDSSGLSYDCINRILREAHFSSLQMRARRGLT